VKTEKNISANFLFKLAINHATVGNEGNGLLEPWRRQRRQWSAIRQQSERHKLQPRATNVLDNCLIATRTAIYCPYRRCCQYTLYRSV